MPDHVNNPVTELIAYDNTLPPFSLVVAVWLKHEGETTIRGVSNALEESYSRAWGAICDLEKSGLVEKNTAHKMSEWETMGARVDGGLRGNPDKIVWVGP